MTAENDRQHHLDTSRLEAFSDGVFAIAITLLIIALAWWVALAALYLLPPPPE